jgi:thiol-disulfide isomerase/thioredoxin
MKSIRPAPVLLSLCACACLGARAEEPGAGPAAPEPEVAAAPAADPAQRLLDAARTEGSDFAAALEAARAAGVSEARLVQARTLHAITARDLRGLVELADAIDEHRAGFDIGVEPGDSDRFAFRSPREVEGLAHALKAVRAYQADDEATFEGHATAAFAAWPEWVDAFQLGKILQDIRTNELVAAYAANLTLAPDTPLRDLAGNALVLGDLSKGGQKAVLLDFWASWCGPCMQLMPELKKRAESLSTQGIYVAAVNTDEDSPLEKAAKVKADKGMDMPWLVEVDGAPLSSKLMIDSIPRMVLISPEGKILFNGHPLDDGLVKALAKLGVTLPEGG